MTFIPVIGSDGNTYKVSNGVAADGTYVQRTSSSPSTVERVAAGSMFIAGAQVRLGGLASTERATFRLLNPSTSTKALYVVFLSLYCDVSQQIEYYEDATLGGTTTSITPRSVNRARPNTSVAQVIYGVGGISGGTVWPNASRVTNTSPLQITLPPLVLPPGKAFLVRGSSSEQQVFTANATWFEE